MFVANWKMYLTYNESAKFIQKNHAILTEIAQDANIVLCPSFESLAFACEVIKPGAISIGAQDVSKYPSGAHTGQVSAQSLKEIGCSYCIIGHSERRAELYETDDIIAEKMVRLLEHDIIPIICIGETEDIYEAGNTIELLNKQLAPVVKTVQESKISHICIAYEPVWSIGAGKIPDAATLTTIFANLYKTVHTQLPRTHIKLLYGGSVNEKNTKKLADIDHIDGFLIGNASTDFQKFEKIVSLVCNSK